MKITRNTPDQLIIENNPLWLAIFISVFSLVFVGIGLFTIRTEPGTGIAFLLGGLVMGGGFTTAFIRRTQLILDRPRNLVELRRKSLLGYHRRSWDLHDLDRALVETSHSSDTNTYRAALHFSGGMDAGTHPVTLVYSSGSGARRAETAINDWLATLDSTPPAA